MQQVKVAGGCHCGAVGWEADLPARITAQECNCSICAKTGYIHVVIPGSRFRLLSGEDQLTEYKFNSGVARHLFCKICGVKSFYVSCSRPDGYSLNLRAMDQSQFEEIVIELFDGKNWEPNAAGLTDLSKE